VAIESDDHKLMAITKQTTKLDGSLRLRSSILFVLPTVWAMTSAEITVSIALKTAADSMTGQMKENSLSCIGSNGYLRGKIFILTAFSLKQEVLGVVVEQKLEGIDTVCAKQFSFRRFAMSNDKPLRFYALVAFNF
jgi:hypothetical protein